jgi:hypothetical protein
VVIYILNLKGWVFTTMGVDQNWDRVLVKKSNTEVLGDGGDFGEVEMR